MLNIKPHLPGLLLAALIIAFSAGSTLAQIKIGTNGATIAPASLLELESANQGLLLPRMADTAAINALNPPNGMLIYLTKAPAIGLYVRKVSGWEYLTGSLGGNGNFNSLTVAGSVTAVNFSGNLIGNATTATTALNASNSANSAVTNDIVNPAITYPVFVNSTPGNQPLRTSSGNLSYVPATGILTARGFIGPLTGDVTGNATSSIDAQNTVNMRITDDLVTPATMYPTFVTGTSGPLPPKVSSGRLSFIPLTGELTAPTFRGALLGNATSATSVTGNVSAVNGGTGQSIYSPGDMLYASSSTSLVKLPIGTPGTILRVSAGNIPSWSTAGAGTVINVTGVANRISVTDQTVSPVIDIASTYAGQASINTVGTITSGIWNGTPVTATFGGTGLNTLPLGRVLIGNGTGTVASVNGDVPNLVLTSNGPGLAPTFKSPGAGDMVLNVDQTVTGIKTFGQPGNVGKLVLAGNTSGATTLNGPAAGLGGTVVLPLSGTLTTLAGTETLTNKTLTSPTLTDPSIGAATGTTLVLGGGTPLGTTNQTGTGRIVMDNTPILITPNIGVASGTSLNLGGGTVTAAQFSGNAATVSAVGGVAAGLIASGATAANAATNSNTAGEIVKRDASGNFSAGTITAALIGNAATATSATTAGTATNANNTAITDDNATVAATYPTFVIATSSNQAQRVSSAKLTFVPSTGLLTATLMKAGQFTSTATGIAPFVVESNIAVVNLQSATATALHTPRMIYGTSFNGTADLPGPVLGEFGGTGVANANKTITIGGGNFFTAGSGTLTLTTTAISDVTIPTIGTLYGTKANSITSAELSNSINGETGTGDPVFSIFPALDRPRATFLIGNSTLPTNTLGTGVTSATVVGTNLAGTVQIVHNGGGVGGGDLVTITYIGTAFPAGSYPVLFPANAVTAALTDPLQVFAVGTTTNFTIKAGTNPLPANTYKWNYHVIGN